MKRWFWVLIGLLLIFSLACGLLPGRARDAVEQVATTVAEVAPAGDDGPATRPGEDPAPVVPDDDDDALVFDSDALDKLDSYRATITWRSELADGTVEGFTMEQWATRNPPAQRFIMNADDGGMEFVQIGNESYMRWGDSWMQTSSDSESDFGDMLAGSDGWLSDVDRGNYEYHGRKNVNGVQTRHYSVQYDAGMLSWFADDETDHWESGTAEVWISDEPNLPRFAVKYEIVITGQSGGQSAKLTMTQDVTEINQPFTIEAPEGVGGIPDDIPMYPDATDVTSMAGFTMFTVSDDLATVNAFYEDALAAAGWSRDEDGMVMDEMVSTYWYKDGHTLSLMISSGDDGTSVMISID